MDELFARVTGFLRQVGPSRRLLILLFVLIVLVTAIVTSLGGSNTSTVANHTSATTGSASVSSSTGSAAVNSPTFYVHVVGRVKNPGVYELEVGSRLFDAVVAAGGFTSDADQASVNLARQLSDGEQIIILKLGTEASISNPTTQGTSNQPISINRASESELESLPGVGPALANRIIDWRVANGGFKRKEDLLQVGGIGSKLFASIEKLVSL